ncbi:MAG: squalene/phytoene synthase family protein [Sandarakinorhabdus sp.]|nr:squalene/phytoene synthase family protein [Sandarakinorhabdus sp.]
MIDALADMLQKRDRERWLSILWAPAAARPALVALHAYDIEQQRVVAEIREPMLAEIRLAWWREQLEALAGGQSAPPQPILRALGGDARARAVDLAGLVPIEEGFLPLLAEGPVDPLELAAARGGPLFRCLMTAVSARALTSAEAADATAAGTRWALAQLWRGRWGQAEALIAGLDRPVFPDPASGALPAALATLDALAADDRARLEAGRHLAPAASPGRQWRMAMAALRCRY